MQGSVSIWKVFPDRTIDISSTLTVFYYFCSLKTILFTLFCGLRALYPTIILWCPSVGEILFHSCIVSSYSTCTSDVKSQHIFYSCSNTGSSGNITFTLFLFLVNKKINYIPMSEIRLLPWSCQKSHKSNLHWILD